MSSIKTTCTLQHDIIRPCFRYFSYIKTSSKNAQRHAVSLQHLSFLFTLNANFFFAFKLVYEVTYNCISSWTLIYCTLTFYIKMCLELEE